nr:hypothetical protein [Pseudalkalibacillus decolorationis]
MSKESIKVCGMDVMSSFSAQPLGSLQASCGGNSLLVGLPVTFVANQGACAFLIMYCLLPYLKIEYDLQDKLVVLMNHPSSHPKLFGLIRLLDSIADDMDKAPNLVSHHKYKDV